MSAIKFGSQSFYPHSCFGSDEEKVLKQVLNVIDETYVSNEAFAGNSTQIRVLDGQGVTERVIREIVRICGLVCQEAGFSRDQGGWNIGFSMD